MLQDGLIMHYKIGTIEKIDNDSIVSSWCETEIACDYHAGFFDLGYKYCGCWESKQC